MRLRRSGGRWRRGTGVLAVAVLATAGVAAADPNHRGGGG